MTFVIITGGIDLSVGSMTALAGAFAILTLNAVTQGLATLRPSGWGLSSAFLRPPPYRWR
jgi:ribose/xylose/arabinose/galactoside ABC-type transport system permease subunit